MNLLTLKDARIETVFDFSNFKDLVLEYMGEDAEYYINKHIKALQDEADYTTRIIETDINGYEPSLHGIYDCMRVIDEITLNIEKLLGAKKN